MYEPFARLIGTRRNEFVRKVLSSEGCEYVKDYEKRGWSYHVRRCAGFVRKIKDGKKLDAISVDNRCSDNRVLPCPVVPDGHHRLIASKIAGSKWIACEYGGRLDLLRYLQGRRKTPPVE
jgi:hypothetical protein